MATENKKMKDPTEAALSAIEQALNLDEHSLAKETPKADPVTGEKIDDPKLPDVDDHDFTTGPFRDLDHEAQRREPRLPIGEDGRPSYVAPDRAAVANDDRQNVGMMLQALQVRPSRRAYFFATVVSLLWLGGLGALVYSQGITTPETLLAAFSPIQLAIGGFVLFAPVILFFIAAMLAVRSQEMRLVARAVGEVAVRLAQPESFSTDAVLSVSQAVRREVAAVGDGVERALARAGELETLVRSEISTLERAYTDNEIRIRSLIDELVTQREAIVNNAERVRSAINGSHQNLTQDLDAAAQRVAAAVQWRGRAGHRRPRPAWRADHAGARARRRAGDRGDGECGVSNSSTASRAPALTSSPASPTPERESRPRSRRRRHTSMEPSNGPAKS